MADAGQFAKDTDILLRVGNGAHATVKVAGFFDTLIIDAEAIINCMTRFDWSSADTTTTLNTTVRGLLIDAGACLAAIEGVTWDMANYNSRLEAEDLINVLRDRALFIMGILSDKKVQTFMVNA